MEKIDIIYRKFKSYIYYEHTALKLKDALIQFESADGFSDRLTNIENFLDRIDTSEITKESPELVKLLEKINYNVIPKKIKNDTTSNENCISNHHTGDTIEISDINFLFDGPIELYLVTFYWILKYGLILEKAYKKFNYASSLYEKNATLRDTTLRTFKPYFKQYAKWRDDGINKVRQCYENRESSSILMLDIRRYYYSIEFDFADLNNYFGKELNPEEYKKYENITAIVEEIIERYNKVLRSKNIVIEGNTHPNSLPLGLPISPLLANFYFRRFDEAVHEKLRPLYYGRYIDDIMIVMPEASYQGLQNSNSDIINEFIKRNFIEMHELMEIEKDNNGEETVGKDNSGKETVDKDNNSAPIYKVVEDYAKNIEFQGNKIKLFIFDKDGSNALIEQFISNIKANSSEFRYLPNDYAINTEFNRNAYTMFAGDTVNKFRNIEKFYGNKYGVSKSLAKIILSSKYWNDSNVDIRELIDQIKRFFSGSELIEYYTLWEKVFVLLVINKCKTEIVAFYKQILETIDKIIVDLPEKNSKTTYASDIDLTIKRQLIDFCKVALSQACSLNFEFFKGLKFSKFDEGELLIKCSNTRNTNMFRHDYMTIPLINYLKGANDLENYLSLNVSCNLAQEGCDNCSWTKDCKMDFDDRKYLYSPRYVDYYEVMLLRALVEAYKWNERSYEETYLKEEKEIFLNINQMMNYKEGNHFPEIFRNPEGNSYNIIKIPSDEKKLKLRIAVASIIVERKDPQDNPEWIKNLTRPKFKKLIELINLIERTNCDIVVLPELSIPFEWLGIVAAYARRQQRAFIFGTEHYMNKNRYALNYLVSIIPFRKNGLNHSFIRLRLKNHYAPAEIELLKGYRYNIPENQNNYDLIYWKGCRFSSYNCFELADIRHRSIFKGKVDFITASEYNPDIEYFGNIAESVARDIHCYFIQSNSADYGDSRIVKPAKGYKKDMVKLKGGRNYQIVYDEIDIQSLREFQVKEFNLQKNDESFKPTPPDFDRSELEELIKNHN